LIQLTWQTHVGFVYDRNTLEQIDAFDYPTEGWGLTYDGTRLIMSDGTSTLHLLDPQTYKELKTITVTADGEPVTRLNELEIVDGELWANIWQTDRIARIDLASGHVVGWIDLSGLLSDEDRSEPVDVLNGIAYDGEGKRLFVTGKLWPRLFQIELVPESTRARIRVPLVLKNPLP
jgi:glutamine cyclotransferase